MKITGNQYFGLDRDKKWSSFPGATYIATDTKKIYIYDNAGLPVLATSSNAVSGANIIVDFYSSLPMNLDQDSIAFVINNQGTKWLPGTLGGNYYSSGWYIFSNGIWVFSRELVDEQLETFTSLISANTTLINDHVSSVSNPHLVTKSQLSLGNVDNTSDISKPLSNAAVIALANKSDIGHVHDISEITGFDSLDYATAAQGVKADSSVQPGANVSVLINDSGYIYGTVVTSFRSDVELGVIYSGYFLDSIIVIKKEVDGFVYFAENLTNLETDWSNRLTLSYV
jgi:hypothetical protein